MSVPCGSAAPFFSLDHRVRTEIMAHRAKVYAALSQHSDPTLREIGRLLAACPASPQQLRDDPRHAETLRRGARKPTTVTEAPHRHVFEPDGPGAPGRSVGAPGRSVGTPGRSVDTPDAHFSGPYTLFDEAVGFPGPSRDRARPHRSREAGPASRGDDTDPDNGAGGVPAIRR